MSVLFKRLFLAALLACSPAVSMAQSDDTSEDAVTTGASAEADETDASDEAEAETEVEVSEADEWAEKLRRRHHEGDVALGVCGGRMTALMWFYQSSVADGREDLQPAYDAIKASRTVLKNEAERRAVDDGIGTSVSVMNEHSTELWEGLITASEKPEDFQAAHDDLFENVQECLTMFFKRPAVKAQAEPVESEEETDTEAASESDEGKAE